MTQLPVAIRLSCRVGAEATPPSRFGIPIEEAIPSAQRWSAGGHVVIDGLHFHLDGYAAADRVEALDQTMQLADNLRDAGIAEIDFIDIGGGFPMRYLESEDQWTSFWDHVEGALKGTREPTTYRNHGYGLIAHGDEIVGKRQAYPHAQSPVGHDWLRSICDSPRPSDTSKTIAESLTDRKIRMHCEPGRALLDGCGMTLARVEHRKKVGDDWHIGLAMNSSNCRSQKSESFVDPRVVPAQTPGNESEPITGFLAGAYCSESDLIMQRQLYFPNGVEVGDIVVIPNTAGYLMHFTESRSHQFPLPLNVNVSSGSAVIDQIDNQPTAI